MEQIINGSKMGEITTRYWVEVKNIKDCNKIFLLTLKNNHYLVVNRDYETHQRKFIKLPLWLIKNKGLWWCACMPKNVMRQQNLITISEEAFRFKGVKYVL